MRPESRPPCTCPPAARLTSPSAGGSGSGILRTIIALVVVIGIIFAISKILKAVKGRDAVRASGNGLEQIATLPIAAGKSVSLLRSGTDIILLGVGDHGVTPIKTYTEDEAIAAGIDLPEDDGRTSTPPRSRWTG